MNIFRNHGINKGVVINVNNGTINCSSNGNVVMINGEVVGGKKMDYIPFNEEITIDKVK